MKPIHSTRLFCLVAGLFLLFTGCAHTPRTDTRAEAWDGKSLESFPYHPLVYHLDLSILAYQLYGQSLVWPFDPYYEELGDDRDRFIAKVHAWTKVKGAEQPGNTVGLDAYRGPGVLGGFADNPHHDPILYNYAHLHPWSNSITNADGQWTEYMTPGDITGRIRDVYVAYRKTTGGKEDAVSLDRVVPGRDDRAADADDVLLAFEGGTGDKGEADQPASQSLMGFVLLRTKPGGHYDVHIAFRGSRSGSAGRAIWQAFSDQQATGNPDWITDMGYNRLVAGQGAEFITTTSEVNRGFARSMQSIFPQVFHCLNKVADINRGISPDNIYVTGHSLGGALAQHFASAVLLGDRYGPNGAGNAMPAALKGWPWKQIKLITYGAPRAGDRQWAKTLTESGLDSEFFSSALNPIDSHALAVTDPRIVSRLLDSSRPAGYRVLISRDPVSTEKVGGGGKHVGKTIYVNEPTLRDLLPPPDPGAHEPKNIRKYMVDSLADPRTPAIAWRYLQTAEMVTDQNATERGSVTELMKLAAAIKHYYADNGIWFDNAAFDRDVALRFTINGGE
ncbi:MAG: hypothetical protein WBQ78_16920 [Gammaproteobacteria bacterium]